MRDTILYDSAMRLFGDHATPQTIAAAEAGTWPAALWNAVSEAGYLDVLVEGPEGMVEAATILRAAGHHAAPIPLPETMLARWLCAAAGLDAPSGVLTVAPVEPGDRMTVTAGGLSGEAGYVPWGGEAAAVAIIVDRALHLASRGQARFDGGKSVAGEPRDRLTGAKETVAAPLANTVTGEQVFGIGALLRAAQMAGAMEAALDLSTRYANDRVQFGRPIGKFQAIQQQLALLAEEAAASLVAVESAAQRVAAAHPMADIAIASAKIRTGEAAGKVAEIAHQVHGAIGFTKEHSLHHLTRRLWSWRDEFGDEAYWATSLGRRITAGGADRLWPTITAS
jgi:acyl-CoA dehydrogenase